MKFVKYFLYSIKNNKAKSLYYLGLMPIIEILYIVINNQIDISKLGLELKDRFLFLIVFVVLGSINKKLPFVPLLYSKSNLEEYIFIYIERFKHYLLLYFGIILSSIIFNSYDKSTLLIGLLLIFIGINYQLYGYINSIISSRMPKATKFQIAKASTKVTGSIVASFFLVIFLLIGLDYLNINNFTIFSFYFNIKATITLIYLISITIILHILDFKYVINKQNYINIESLEMSRFINKYRKKTKLFSLFR